MVGCALGLGCERQLPTYVLDSERAPVGPACESVSCGPPQPTGDPFITTQQCGTGSRAATIVWIDRSRPNSEIWTIEEIDGSWTEATAQTHPETYLRGSKLDDETMWSRSQAAVQINGYTFDCALPGPFCYWLPIDERAMTQVYESTHQLSSNAFASNTPPYPAHLVMFSPVGPKIGVDLLPTTANQASHAYNGVQSLFPALSDGETCAKTPAYDLGDTAQSAVGYNDQSVVMAQFTQATRARVCQVLECLNVRGAMMMDGGDSSGISLRTPQVVPIGHTRDRNIAYRIGLVTLGRELIQNGGFEAPSLETYGNGTLGFHSFAGEQVPRKLVWSSGSAWVYNTGLYFERFKELVPSKQDQVAAIHPHGALTEYLSQSIQTPAGRYCMLHFWHGYRKPTGCHPEQSSLEVTVHENNQDGSPRTRSLYQSPPTHQGLHEEWLRFLTTTTLTAVTFRALDPPGANAQGNCEVLLDDVSVRCASEAASTP